MLLKKQNPNSSNSDGLQVYEDNKVCCSGELGKDLCHYALRFKTYNSPSTSTQVDEIITISIGGETYDFEAPINVTTNEGREQFLSELFDILEGLGYSPEGEIGFVLEANGDFSLITSFTDLVFEAIQVKPDNTIGFIQKCKSDAFIRKSYPIILEFTKDNPDTEVVLPGSIEYFQTFVQYMIDCVSKFFMIPIKGSPAVGAGYGTSISYDYENGGPLDYTFQFNMDKAPFDGDFTDEMHTIRLVKDHPVDPDGAYYDGVQTAFGPIIDDNGSIITFGIEISYLADIFFKLNEFNYQIVLPNPNA